LKHRYNPGNHKAHFRLATVKVALVDSDPKTDKVGKLTEAVASLEEADRLNPGAKATLKKLEETKSQLAEEQAMAAVEPFGSGV